MKVTITGNNVEITESVKQLVDEKINKGLDKHLKSFDPEIKTADVTLTQRTRWGYKASLDMWLPGKEHIYAEMKGKTLAEVVVNLREAIEKQLKKYREKIGTK